jgi:hypothetical protein
MSRWFVLHLFHYTFVINFKFLINMADNFLEGIWTYRSYLNYSTPVDNFDSLRFGQGEMVFETASEGILSGQLAFRSNPLKLKDSRLKLTGSVEIGSPVTIRFQGVGVEGTDAQGWIYDYIGYLVPNWPNGKKQQTAIVGSVIRTAPHSNGQGGISQAGLVASFIAVKCDFVEPRVAIPLPRSVTEMLASRGHRLHHFVWHNVRNKWLDTDLDDSQRQKIHHLGWAPLRPAMEKGSTLVENGSGEDFLFMHRQMILKFNEEMQKAGAKAVKGWQNIPAPGPLVVEPDFDSSEPKLPPVGNPNGDAVPPTWNNRRITAFKSDEYYWSQMRSWDKEFKNPAYLRTLTLGELGALIEFSVHNDMHMRWASVTRDPETGEAKPEGRKQDDISEKWDDPTYDYLGEFYSSHVNPIFWRLHGWVDDRIEDWFKAHEAVHPGEVERITLEGVPWFKQGKWVVAARPWAGPSESGNHRHASFSHHHDVEKMEQVVNILFDKSVKGLIPQ